MKEVQETYLELLKAALWGNEVTSERLTSECLTNEGVNDVIRLAAFQGTGPLVYDQLLKLKDVEIPTDLRMQMKQQCVHSMMLQQSMVPIFVKAWKALEDADIHPVLLKGYGLAQYYPQPHLRQWGDIDLYVGETRFYDACRILRDTFSGIKHTTHEETNRKHYNFVFENTMIEVHRVSMTFNHPHDRRYYEGLEERCLTKDGPKLSLERLDVTLSEETFNVFFVFLHAWHHFIETGMNTKQLCDIAILLHTKREAINIKQLQEMLCKLHLLEVWQLIMYIMVHHLGVPQEECPFYKEKSRERAELLFERIITEGSARQPVQVNAEGVSYLKRKWVTLQLRIADSNRIRQYAPSYARHLLISNILHGLERTLKGK